MAALPVWRVLSDVHGRAAIFATHGQTLQQAQCDQDDRGGNADRFIVGEETDDEGGQTHHQDSRQECVFSTDHVAQATEKKRAERPYDEARRKRKQRKDQTSGRVRTCKKLFRDDRCQGTIKKKVIPLKNGA